MRFAVVFVLCALAVGAQSGPEAPAGEDEFRVYTDHPRLFLRAQRLRLLKRERDRQSMRWTQFEALIRGGAQMPQPGFALALYHAVTGDADVGRRAVEWAVAASADVRQSALVYDWCQDVLTPAQSKTLAGKLAAAARDGSANDIRGFRTRALAAIAVADELPDHGELPLRDVIDRWWRKEMAPALAQGRDIAPGEDMLALFELLHATRDNLMIDLRTEAPGYFSQLAPFYVTSHYPAPYPAAENEYRIPVYKGAGQPNLDSAAISRVAGLCQVAYDTNAVENQFLQGWLMQDRFLLRGALGSPYEFLWANPYQPGLSYAHLPLTFHDTRSGDLFIRSTWDEDAVWFGLYQGEAQVFRDGKITVLRQSAASAAQSPRVMVGDTATVALARAGARFSVTGAELFIIGLRPEHNYDVEVEDEEMTEMKTDRGGTLRIVLPRDVESAVRLRDRSRS